MLNGTDVSYSQGSVNWHHLAPPSSGLRFAFAKATEGTQGMGSVDPTFRDNWPAMREAGLTRGAYHFANPHPTYGTSPEGLRRQARGEVEHFLSTVDGAGGMHHGDLPPTLDWEPQNTEGLNDAQLYDWVGYWVDAMAAEVGVKPIIYTGYFWKDRMAGYDSAFGCPLWLASYTAEPVVPKAWERESWTFWQHGEGSIAGIDRTALLDRFHGSYDQLEALTLGHGSAAHSAAAGHHHDEPGPRHVPAAAPLWHGRVLSEGLHGEDVRRWQEQMRRRGFVHLSVNGHYGPESAESCRWLELYLRLPPSGRVDERVWRATWQAA
jgi:lysozyme